MAEPVFALIVRFVLTIMLAIPIWLVMFWLYSKCTFWLYSKCADSMNPTVSLVVFLLGVLLCWKAAFSISARAFRREDLKVN